MKVSIVGTTEAEWEADPKEFAGLSIAAIEEELRKLLPGAPSSSVEWNGYDVTLAALAIQRANGT